MSAEGFEKTRIQNPDEAHEEANMIRLNAQESFAVSKNKDGKPKARDYEEALEMLVELQEDAREGTSIDKIVSKIQLGSERAGEILDLAFLNIADMTGPSDSFSRGDRSRLIAMVKGFVEGYKADVQRKEDRIISARKTLEDWKAKAEDLVRKETEAEKEAEEFLKKQN